MYYSHGWGKKKKIKNTRNKQKHKTRGSDVDYLGKRNSAELLTKQTFKRNIGNDFKGGKKVQNFPATVCVS